ncbi:acyl-CoA dehydrogenase family protein [Natrialbaceae archaeon A-chndr2]
MSDGFDYGDLEEGRHVNYWSFDRTLQRNVRRIYAPDECRWAAPILEEFGDVIGHTIADNADVIDDHGPELETYDKDGEVVNRVRYPAEQLENERLVYERGIVADSFEAPPGRDRPMPLSHNLVMQYLLSYADVGFDCPVAMTAGAALVLEKFGDEDLEAYYEGLTSREYGDLIEGAMFLTEKQGGSDVGATETIARWDDDADCYRLEGEKWFCSNIDAQGTLALARTPDAPEGTKGLSMFLVPHELDGELNDQLYRRLKDKLGTIAVPTGEVELQGAKAFLVGEEEAGFKQMAEMLNLERLSNAAASCGLIGRALLESKVKAANREAFGDTIDRYPLMRRDLVDMAVDHEAATAFTMEAARLFWVRERAERVARGDISLEDGVDRNLLEVGADGATLESGTDRETLEDEAEDAYRLMRLLIPISKARTGRMAVETASYAMEIQGGNGYVNDFVTNRLLRDAQVLPIWEGTENILSLDVLRALEREAAHEPFIEAVQTRLERISHPLLEGPAETAEAEFHELTDALATLATEDTEYAQLQAKELTHYIFDVFTATLLLEDAQRALEGDTASQNGSSASGSASGSETGQPDARLALVARRFIDRQFEERAARGITSGDRFAIEYFDPIVRYARIEPSSLEFEPASS